MEMECLVSNRDDEIEIYKSIFNNSHTPLLIIDSKSGGIRDANLAACEYYGYSIEEFLRLNVSDINILNKQDILQNMDSANKAGRMYYNFTHRLSNGELREVEVCSGPIMIKGESLLLSIVHDIQYRKEMDEKYQVQESYFKSLYENSPDAIAMLDNEFRIININKSFEKIFQYSLHEIKNHNITRIICEERFYDESTYFKDSIRRGEFVRKETKRRRKDGKLLDISFLGYPIISNGEQIGVYAVYTDMTKVKEEKREQDKKIQMYINVLRSTIDSIPHVMAVYQPDFPVVLLNEAGYKFFEITDRSTKGLKWCELVKGRFHNVELCGTKVLETKETYLDEKWFEETDQWYEWQSTPVLGDEGEVILIVEQIKDITINKRNEKALRNSKERAEEANKFKTQFIANVAHEIRTPMNGIVGIIDLLDDTQLTKKQKEYFQMLRYSAKRLSAVINDVIDIAKIETGKLELRNQAFSIFQLLKDIERYFKIQAEKKDLKLNLNIDEAIPDALYGDADKLNQILFNLLSNAIKFTEQGKICVDVKLSKRSTKRATVKFSVSDTGIGIHQDQVDRIFEDFMQLDDAATKRYGGAGLGLAISKGFVELMGGSIDIESEYGKGSNFAFQVSFKIVTLKNTIEEIKCSNVIEKASAVLPALNVLTIEDESINQQIIKSFLEKENCTVTMAANGKEALNILDRQSFDMILMDIFMPEMDGFELAKMIRDNEKAHQAYTPIIAITAAVANEVKEKHETVGIDGYVAKPFVKEQLYKAIIDVLSKRRKMAAFDLNPLINALDGNHQLLGDIIYEVVRKEYQAEFIDKIELYAANNDYDHLNKQLHKFRGSISHFQIASLNNILLEIKECCRRKDAGPLGFLIDKLKSEYLSLRDYLIEYQKTKKLL